jgi:hypothetical protein
MTISHSVPIGRGERRPVDSYGPAAWGLRRYLRLVAEAVGLDTCASSWDLNRPVSVYLPLDGRTPELPGTDLAMVWSEHEGWSVAVENGTRLQNVAWLSGDVLPQPAVVAAFVTDFLTSGTPAGPAIAHVQSTATGSVLDRLAAYRAEA